MFMFIIRGREKVLAKKQKNFVGFFFVLKVSRMAAELVINE